MRSTPSADPDHPEHARLARSRDRQAINGRQLRAAAVLYALAVVLTALYPGLILGWLELPLYAASGALVAAAVLRGWVGLFGASFLQGALSLALVLRYGPMQFLIIFMLAGHAMLPMLLWHWAEMIHDANR